MSSRRDCSKGKVGDPSWGNRPYWSGCRPPLLKERGKNDHHLHDRDGPATGEDCARNTRPEGPGRGEQSQAAAKWSRSERPSPAPERPAGGGGITSSGMSATEEADEKEEDVLAKREERAEEGDRPPRHLLLEWDFSLLDERPRRHSEQEDSLELSLWPAEPVAETVPVGEPHLEQANLQTHTRRELLPATVQLGAMTPHQNWQQPKTQRPLLHPTAHWIPMGWGTARRGPVTRPWAEGWSCPQLQEQTPPAT